MKRCYDIRGVVHEIIGPMRYTSYIYIILCLFKDKLLVPDDPIHPHNLFGLKVSQKSSGQNRNGENSNKRGGRNLPHKVIPENKADK